MAQRKSGYERKERDFYPTPEWVTQVILPFIPNGSVIWEPACGDGAMARVLKAKYATDLFTFYGVPMVDFTTATLPKDCNAIITNPPFNKGAEAFIRHSLSLLENSPGAFAAMLLPIDFDSAKTRQDVFGACPHFAGKIVLTKRIVWFNDPEKKSAPSMNHAWFFWRIDHNDHPRIYYHV